MNKLFKFFMFWSIPLLSVMLVSCGDDSDDPDPIVEAPSITSVAPGEAAVGDMVTITGANLADVTDVRFGTVDADFTADNSTTISVTVPQVEAGAQTITVVGPGGNDTFAFTVTDPTAPTFVSFSPASGGVGTVVTIVGTNLDRIASVSLGDVDATSDWAVAEDGNTATFSVPEGAASGTITLVDDNGAELTNATSFTIVEEGNTVADYNVTVRAQGVRNDEGEVTAFSADGETYTLVEGVEMGEDIDFIAADSGGDDNLDLFSPAHEGWLEGNYFEDSEDAPVEWSVRNQTQMRRLEEGEIDFENATAEEINALELGEEWEERISVDDGVGAVILFLTAEGQKGIIRWTDHDPIEADTKNDAFIFDIKVVE